MFLSSRGNLLREPHGDEDLLSLPCEGNGAMSLTSLLDSDSLLSLEFDSPSIVPSASPGSLDPARKVKLKTFGIPKVNITGMIARMMLGSNQKKMKEGVGDELRLREVGQSSRGCVCVFFVLDFKLVQQHRIMRGPSSSVLSEWTVLHYKRHEVLMSRDHKCVM